MPTLIARIVAYVHVYLVALTGEYHSDGAFGRIAQDLPQRFGQLLYYVRLLPRTAVTAELAFCYVAVHFHAEELIRAADIRAEVVPTRFRQSHVVTEYPLIALADFVRFCVISFGLIVGYLTPSHVGVAACKLDGNGILLFDRDKRVAAYGFAVYYETVEYFAARHGAVKDELNFVLFVVYRFAVLGSYARSL